MKVPPDVQKKIDEALAEGRATEYGPGSWQRCHLASSSERLGEAVSGKLTEKEFTKLVIEIGHEFGWIAAHFRPAQVAPGTDGKARYVTAVAGDGRGFPDLVLVRDRIIFVELKVTTKLKPDQKTWRDRLRAGGGLWYEWRPCDLPLIRETLK